MARVPRVTQTTQGCCHKGSDRSASSVLKLEADSPLSTPFQMTRVGPQSTHFGRSFPTFEVPKAVIALVQQSACVVPSSSRAR